MATNEKVHLAEPQTAASRPTSNGQLRVRVEEESPVAPLAAAGGAGTVFDVLWSVLETAGKPAPAALAAALARLPEDTGLPPQDHLSCLLQLLPAYLAKAWALREIFTPLVRDHYEVRRSIVEQQTLEGRCPHLPEWSFRLEYCFGENWWIARHRPTQEQVLIDSPKVNILKPYQECGPQSYHLVWPENPFALPEEVLFGHLPEPGVFFTQPRVYQQLVEQLCAADDSELWVEVAPDDPPALMRRLVRGIVDHAEVVMAYHDEDTNPVRRLWLAALLGDWDKAHALARETGNADLIAVTAARTSPAAALMTHEDTATEGQAGTETEEGERRTFWKKAEAAWENDVPGWEAAAEERLFRSDPSDIGFGLEVPARYLLSRSGDPHKVVEALLQRYRASRQDGDDWDVDAALLAAEYAPDLGKEIFHRALCSPKEIVQIEAIAALAILDQPWVEPLLREAAKQSKSPLAQYCCWQVLQEHRIRHGKLNSMNEADLVPSNQRGLLTVGTAPAGPDDSPMADPGITNYWCEGEWVSQVRYYGTVQEFLEDQISQIRE